MEVSAVRSDCWAYLGPLVERATLSNDPLAQLELGKAYALGAEYGDADDCLRPDPAQALKWLSAAANQGVAEAIYWLGLCFDAAGLGFLNEPDLAMGHYRQAWRSGFSPAHLAMAEMHLAGRCSGASAAKGWRILLAEGYSRNKQARLRIAELLEADGRLLNAAGWRIVAGEESGEAPDGAREIAGYIGQISFFHTLVNSGEEITRNNLSNWLRASFTA